MRIDLRRNTINNATKADDGLSSRKSDGPPRLRKNAARTCLFLAYRENAARCVSSLKESMAGRSVVLLWRVHCIHFHSLLVVLPSTS